MAKLIAMGAFFGITLDELVLGTEHRRTTGETLQEIFLTPDNGRRLKTAFRWGLAGAGVVLALDALSLAVYLLVWGIPG